MKKIFEIAMELKVTTRRILEFLNNMGYDISRNQMQPVSEEMYLAILQEFDTRQVEEVVENIPEADTILDAIRQRINAIQQKNETASVPLKLETKEEKLQAVPKPKVEKAKKTEKVDKPEKAVKPKLAEKPEKVAKPEKMEKVKQVAEVVQAMPVVQEHINMEVTPMTIENSLSVDDSFKYLISAIRSELKGITRKSMEAIENGDFETVRLPLERAAKIPKLLDKINEIQTEWIILSGQTGQTKAVETTPPTTSREARAERARKPRLARGTLTPNSAYTIPILQSLIEAGGEAQKSEVIRKVSAFMAGTFNKFDIQPPDAHPKTPRWQIKFDKIRVSLISKGLLASDTDSGVWKISKKGREVYKEHKAN